MYVCLQLCVAMYVCYVYMEAPRCMYTSTIILYIKKLCVLSYYKAYNFFMSKKSRNKRKNDLKYKPVQVRLVEKVLKQEDWHLTSQHTTECTSIQPYMYFSLTVIILLEYSNMFKVEYRVVEVYCVGCWMSVLLFQYFLTNPTLLANPILV